MLDVHSDNKCKKLKDLSLSSNAVLHLTNWWQIVLKLSPSFNHQMESLDHIISFLERVLLYPKGCALPYVTYSAAPLGNEATRTMT